MRNSTRYREQAEAVLRLAGKAASTAEKEVYHSIAEGWRKLAAEARRNEARGPNVPQERRSFTPDERRRPS